MKGYTAAAVAMLAAIASSPAGASAYTYDMNGIQGITGSITTNCDKCVLNASDVTAWSFMSPDFSGPAMSISSSAAGSQLFVQGSALAATPNAVTFQFTPSPTQAIVEFYSNNQSIDFLNFGDFASAPFMFPNGIGQVDVCSGGFEQGSSTCFGGLYSGTQPIASAATRAAPEMDPRSFATALTLLFGALAVLRGRRQCRGLTAMTSISSRAPGATSAAT
jgi:hypothetical protein